MAALLSGRQGTSDFRLMVDAGGHVGGCRITRASGSTALDDAACFALVRRARFEPSRDGRGCPVPSSYPSAVKWLLPMG